jgi:hypothetical protein
VDGRYYLPQGADWLLTPDQRDRHSCLQQGHVQGIRGRRLAYLLMKNAYAGGGSETVESRFCIISLPLALKGFVVPMQASTVGCLGHQARRNKDPELILNLL